MGYIGHAQHRRGVRGVVGILLILSLAGCTPWRHATKPSEAFAADASACEAESFRATTVIDGSDTARHQAYLACLRARGWSLQDNR